ncbi:hypothetical protein WA026_009071 [Henosepilachna vigintioctopunctata]|uniref:Uncharacterized protein n=1 Tax=Henosepilachna vigintioctopunctata TaxID=420089 RepID=A0AAW1UQM2_9CUCU
MNERNEYTRNIQSTTYDDTFKLIAYFHPHIRRHALNVEHLYQRSEGLVDIGDIHQRRLVALVTRGWVVQKGVRQPPVETLKDKGIVPDDRERVSNQQGDI